MELHLVICVNPNMIASILSVQDNHQQAIDFLTKYIDKEFVPKDRNYKVYQKSASDYEIWSQGYLYKSLVCKLQIIPVNISA